MEPHQQLYIPPLVTIYLLGFSQLILMCRLIPAMMRSLGELDAKLQEKMALPEGIDFHPLSAALTLNVIGRTGEVLQL
jgi:hypothetical protein